MSMKGNIALTPSDCFILALEKHNEASGVSGNICHYLMELDGSLQINSLRERLNRNELVGELALYYFSSKSNGRRPSWSRAEEVPEIDIQEIRSDSKYPPEIFEKNRHYSNAPLFQFVIVQRSKGSSALVMSWHHLLMDGHGAGLLLKHIAEERPLKDGMLAAKDNRVKWSIRELREAWKAKTFVDTSSRNPLSGVFHENEKRKKFQGKIKVIEFSEEETKHIDQQAVKLGARFGRSPHYLAALGIGVQKLLKSRGEEVQDFWVPVPQDHRKKGASGPIIGNHLSFLFYRLEAEKMNSLKDSVRSVNDQMIDQLRNQNPDNYKLLMSYMRHIPSSIYYHLIKGPKGKSLSSFLFTVAADHPDALMTFENLKVKNALSFPPNTYPPGLTFALMRFQNRLQIMMVFHAGLINPQEEEKLESNIRKSMLNV